MTVWLARRAKVAALLAAHRAQITDLTGRLRGLASAHADEIAAMRAAKDDQLAQVTEQAHRWCLEAESRRGEQVRQAKALAALQQEHQALITQLGMVVRERDELREARHGG